MRVEVMQLESYLLGNFNCSLVEILLKGVFYENWYNLCKYDNGRS
jgi:hypothetical protein